jgi:hypothetical protein
MPQPTNRPTGPTARGPERSPTRAFRAPAQMATVADVFLPLDPAIRKAHLLRLLRAARRAQQRGVPDIARHVAILHALNQRP